MMWHYYHYETTAPLGVFTPYVLLVLYFIPSLIAFMRGHHNRWAIFMLNLLLGWTALGWIVALIWSLTMVQKQTTRNG